MALVHPIFIALFYLFVGSLFSEAKNICSVEHLEAIELPRFQNRNHTNVLISWKNNCKEKQIQIKVKHLLFLGCKNSKRDFSSIVHDVDGGLESFIVENLFHFSEYQLELCFLSACDKTWSQRISTKVSVPRVRVQSSSFTYDHDDTERQLTFNWRPPLQSQCDLFQSNPQYYHYNLIKTNLTSNLHLSGDLPLNTTKINFDNLGPGSCYAFFVFLSNSKKQYHSDFYLKIIKCTEQMKEKVVKNQTKNVRSKTFSSASASSSIIIILVVISSVVAALFLTFSARIMYKRRKKTLLKDEMENYFGTLEKNSTASYSTNNTMSIQLSENDYECLSTRTRSPTDPLPPVENSENDVPGYMKLKNYKIFRPLSIMK